MSGGPSVDCVLDIRAELGECPVWCERDQTLYWIDIYAGRLNRFDPSTGANRVWKLPEPIGSFALCDGRDRAPCAPSPASIATILRAKS